MRVPVPPYPHLHSKLSVSFLKAILMGVEQYFILIHISLMTHYFKPLFLGPLFFYKMSVKICCLLYSVFFLFFIAAITNYYTCGCLKVRSPFGLSWIFCLESHKAVIKLSTGQQDVSCIECCRQESSVKLSQLAGQIRFFVVVGPRFHC